MLITMTFDFLFYFVEIIFKIFSICDGSIRRISCENRLNQVYSISSFNLKKLNI